MKIETKISKISIVCALGMMVTGAAFAASPVRSLGGSGTYTSASSAASSKTTASNRAGTMRVTSVTPTRVVAGSSNGGSVSAGTASSSSVVAAARGGSTPRLSIGKYLANKATVSGGISGGGSNGGSDGEFADKIVIVEGDVKELEAALNLLDERVALLESVDTVTADDLLLVQAAIDAVESAIDALPESLTKDEIEALVSELLTTSGVATQDGLKELGEKLDSLAERMTEVESLANIVAGLQADVAGLKTGVTGLQSAVGDIEGAMMNYLQRPTDSGLYVLQVGDNSAQWVSVKFVDESDVGSGSEVESGDDVVGDTTAESSDPVQGE